MLNSLSRKLCPFLSLAFATLSCGKKINEPKAGPARQTENQEIPSTYVLQIDGKISSLVSYRLPRPAQFEIPQKLSVLQGNPFGKQIDIAYDVNEFDSEDIQFKCTYISSANPTEMILSHCQDYEGDDFGDVTGQKFTLRFNDIIQLKFTGAPAPDLVVDAIYSMKWI